MYTKQMENLTCESEQLIYGGRRSEADSRFIHPTASFPLVFLPPLPPPPPPLPPLLESLDSFTTASTELCNCLLYTHRSISGSFNIFLFLYNTTHTVQLLLLLILLVEFVTSFRVCRISPYLCKIPFNLFSNIFTLFSHREQSYCNLPSSAHVQCNFTRSGETLSTAESTSETF